MLHISKQTTPFLLHICISDQQNKHNFFKEPSNEHAYQVCFQVYQCFQRRRLKTGIILFVLTPLNLLFLLSNINQQQKNLLENHPITTLCKQCPLLNVTSCCGVLLLLFFCAVHNRCNSHNRPNVRIFTMLHNVSDIFLVILIIKNDFNLNKNFCLQQ